MADTKIIKLANAAIVKILDNATSPTTFTVESGPPQRASSVTASTIFVYLYQVLESPTLKNSGYRAGPPSGGPPQNVTVVRDPLALDLYFLIIPASSNDNEQTTFVETYEMLGIAAGALHDNGVFTLGQLGIGDTTTADVKLQVTMNPLTTTQLFELWEAVNQPYRLSASYVVRTVRIDSQLSTDTPLVSQRNLQTTQV